MLRHYSRVASEVERRGTVPTRDEIMRTVADELWTQLSGTDVSWIGFYVDHPHEQDDRRLILGPCRDKPACSPIGLHGVCGQALLSREVRIVHDVRELGGNYIACDPRDRSEIVVPLVQDGTCWGVLDLDSHSIGAFGDDDARGLTRVLLASGLIDSDEMFNQKEQRPDRASRR
jgi:putative methionine-R-sulfoxide reductase with GAF domain